MRRPLIPTKLNATKMAHLAKGAAFDIAARAGDPTEVETIIRWLTALRPVKDKVALLSQTLYEVAAITAPLIDTAETAAPLGLLRREADEHAAEHYAKAGGK